MAGQRYRNRKTAARKTNRRTATDNQLSKEKGKKRRAIYSGTLQERPTKPI